ncbi:hypothetical protein THOE12_100180 [Vibrio rotiferianus]|nr:hypothetical protein THOE12_100180 [Vibrio rotiferianus]
MKDAEKSKRWSKNQRFSLFNNVLKIKVTKIQLIQYVVNLHNLTNTS